MRRVLLAVCASTALLGSFAQASEERWPRWYVGLSSGFNMRNDAEVSGTPSSDVAFDSGYGASMALGYLPPFTSPVLGGLRLEGEIGYYTNAVDSVSTGGVAAAGTGEMNSTAYMANLYYDFEKLGMFVPYVGAGLGVASVDLESLGVNQEDDALAYQAMAGLGYRPETIPMTEWSLGYRYFGTSDLSYTVGKIDNDVHNMQAGIKLRF
jgi:OOP family OmpA-OmpF porin